MRFPSFFSTKSFLGKTHPQKKDVAMTAVATKKWQTEIIDLPFQIKEIDFFSGVPMRIESLGCSSNHFSSEFPQPTEKEEC